MIKKLPDTTPENSIAFHEIFIIDITVKKWEVIK